MSQDRHPADEPYDVEFADSAASSEPKPFFTFWRCCGCLAVLGVVVVIGSSLAFKYAVDSFFDLEPLEMPAIEATEEELAEIEARLEKLEDGDLVELTPEELSVFVQSRLRDPELGLGDQSAFYCGATPDGYLEILVSLQHSPDAESSMFVRPGQFMNMRVVGKFEVEDEQLVEAFVAEYEVGLFSDQNLGTDDVRKMQKTVEESQVIPPDARASFGSLQRFRFNGETIEIQVRGNNRGRSSSSSSPAEAEDPGGSSGEPAEPPTPAGESTGGGG